VGGPAVVVHGVWKKFRRGERHDTLRDLVPSLAKKVLGRTRTHDLEGAAEFWAVENLSFEMAPGEAIGIIGPNGAGKSTTLKLLTRILRPTRGTCHLHGRVGALIEVAAGFHPDLTGRENIFLQGAVMGMKRTEIARKLDEIIEFAGVGNFVDTQVKRYSSGMNARLGFSIAAHLDPDVLVIDEVLSVGDMAFQQRCVERMHEFKRRGTAIVFVSHNLQAVGSLCDRALFLRGSVQQLGVPHEVIRNYVSSMSELGAREKSLEVRIHSARLLDERNVDATDVAAGSELTLRVEYTPVRDFSHLTFGFLVYRSTDNLLVYDANLTGEELGISMVRKGQSVQIDFTFMAHLTRGHYHVVCHACHNPTQSFIGYLSPAAVFSVTEQRTWAGVANLDVRGTARTVCDAVSEQIAAAGASS